VATIDFTDGLDFIKNYKLNLLLLLLLTCYCN